MITPISPEECTELECTSYSTVSILPEEGPYPRSYLEFAKADLEGIDTKRSTVNALSNAKRALHFQVDLIADAFGIREISSGKKFNFPQKLEFCTNCSVVGPRIIRKLNQVRNAMEHEYYIPGKDETEDFVDVVELFIAATDRFINRFPDRVELEYKEEEFFGVASRHVELEVKPGSGVIAGFVQQLEIERQAIHTAAALQKQEIERDIKNTNEQDIMTAYLGIDREAYRRAMVPELRGHAFSVSASNQETYAQWVSILVKKCNW